MSKILDALGEEDEDVQNVRAGIAGLTFENWSDADIAEFAVEMAQATRRDLNDALEKHKASD